MSEIRSGNVNDLSTPRDFGNNCLNDFLTELGDDLTGACMVPVNLPQREIVNIIKRAKKWFYKQYEDSVKENYYHVPKNVFESTYFKNHRCLNLPGAGADESAEELQYSVLNQSLADMSRMILENPISFNYTRLNGELKILGDTPKGDVILHVYETISDCALYSDEIFFRYCSAKIKQSLGAKLGIFKFALPGNVEFDYDAIKDMGDTELESIIEEIKGDEGVDYMFHS